MSKNLFETYEVNGRQYTDNLGHNAFISIPKEQYIEYEQLKEENKQLKEELKNKPDTKCTLTTKDGKELTIIQSERIDMQEELNNTITKLFNQLKNKDSILTELEEWLKRHINSYEERIKLGKGYELTLVMQTHLQCDKNTLDKIQELKEKYK